MIDKRVVWRRVSLFWPNLLNGFDAQTGVWIAQIRPSGGTLLAHMVKQSGREHLMTVAFAKQWVEAQYAKREA